MQTVSSSESAPGVPWATLAPLACVIHCLAAPLLLVMMPAQAEHHALEAGLAAFASVVGLTVVARGFRIHGRWRVLALVVAGMGLWAVALLEVQAFIPERTLSPLAGLLVAGGMFWDARLRPRCACGHDHRANP